MMIRWPGHIEAGKWTNEIFASLDWLPTLVEIAGGPKSERLQGGDRERRVSGHRQDPSRRREPARLPEGKSEKSARETFFYYSGTCLGGALQELEDVLQHGQEGADGWLLR